MFYINHPYVKSTLVIVVTKQKHISCIKSMANTSRNCFLIYFISYYIIIFSTKQTGLLNIVQNSQYEKRDLLTTKSITGKKRKTWTIFSTNHFSMSKKHVLLYKKNQSPFFCTMEIVCAINLHFGSPLF